MQSFFHDDGKNDARVFDAISSACEGLVYLSETDAPVLAFRRPPANKATAEILMRQIGKGYEGPVEEREFNDFFAKLTDIREWYGETETEWAKKFLVLQTLLEENLRDLKVFRIGSVRLEIYAVGISAEGCLMGISTFAVET